GGVPAYRSRETAKVKNPRIQTEIPILIMNQRRPCRLFTGLPPKRGTAFTSSMMVRSRLFRHTQPSTTNGESAASTPRPPVAVTPQQSLKERHVARSQSLVENIARQTVDLHDQKPPARGLRRAATTKPANETVDRTLQQKNPVVQGHRHLVGLLLYSRWEE